MARLESTVETMALSSSKSTRRASVPRSYSFVPSMCTIVYMCTLLIYRMPKPSIVRARVHHGTNSLDLTIPVALCKEYGIHEGDVFVVSVGRDHEVSITYKRILNTHI